MDTVSASKTVVSDELRTSPDIPLEKPLHQRKNNRLSTFLRTDSAACLRLIVLLALGYPLFSMFFQTSNDASFLERTQKNDGSAINKEGLDEPWSTIQPNRNLEFSNCFGDHKCARLSVPMDWNSTDKKSPSVHLAIIKRPAKVPVTDPRYAGMLWLQIGGPGSSGVDFLLHHGKTVQMIADSPKDPANEDFDHENLPKYFDVIAFDPRGVNNTTPHFTCFPNTLVQEIWSMQADAEVVLGSSDNAFANIWTRTTALSQGCTRRIAESNSPEDQLAFHINTSPVVADIVAVIEKHGQWREQEATRLLTERLLTREVDAIRERTKWRRGEEKLLYWGLSYGTLIGATFATMQPQRIERVILDGVVDTSDYYSGEWLKNLQDTDREMDRFSQYCSEAGEKACPLYSTKGPLAIKGKFKSIVETLRNDPIGVSSDKNLAPDLITYTDVKRLISKAVYAPIQYWPLLASLLLDLNHRNGTAFAAIKQASPPIHPLSKHCQHAAPYSQECIDPAISAGDSASAIVCSDGNGTHGMTQAEFAEYAAQLREQSWLIGDVWAQIRLACVAWNIKPKWRFGGPFGGKTAKNMLFVGNKVDPVTPVRKYVPYF
ncbi:hypothetical protein ACLMJK_001389 [Lecanora helva]